MLSKFWSPSSSTQASRTSEEEAKDAERSKRLEEYIERGRLHNESIGREDDDDDDDDDESHAKQNLECEPAENLQNEGTELVRINNAGAVVVTKASQVEGAKAVYRTKEALRAVGAIVEKETYQDGDESIIRYNLHPDVVNSLEYWAPSLCPSTRSQASQAIDLFAGQTLEFGRLLQATLYHVAEGQLLCGEVIAILKSFLYEGGSPPIAKIQDLRRRISRQRRYSIESLEELNNLLDDLDWSREHVGGLVAKQHISARQKRTNWRRFAAAGGSFLCISALFTVGASLAYCANNKGEAKVIAVVATKALGSLGWAASALGYQTKELEADVQRKRSRGEMLGPALESIVDVGYCVKHYKNSFQDLESQFCIPFFTASDLDDGEILDKWMTAEVLFQAFFNQMNAITKTMQEYQIELPLNPYGMDHIFQVP